MSKPIRIIITDDKQLYRQSIKEALADFDILTISEAGNGLELLEQLQTSQPDVVLLDLEMPVMNGRDTIPVLKKNFPKIKIVIISQFDEQVVVDEYLNWGVNGYYIKGDSLSELARGITKVHCGGYFISYNSQARHIKLTARQKEIIDLIAEGRSRENIAAKLRLTPGAVHKQQKKIIQLLGLSDITQLKKQIYKLGLDYLRKPGS